LPTLEAYVHGSRRLALSFGFLLLADGGVRGVPEDANTRPAKAGSTAFEARSTPRPIPLASDKEGASGMSQEAAWKDIANWPPLASSGGTFSSLGARTPWSRTSRAA
jgi:hypothetical protein